MDYFAKFKKRIVPPKVQPTSAMQLAKFHACWNYVHNFFVAEDRKVNVHVRQTEIPEKLRQMVDMLVDEEARQEDNTTGVCMEYFLKNGVLQYLVHVSEKSDYPVGVRGEAIRTVASMVDLLDDRFLVHNAVHKPTLRLLRFCVLDERQSELYHEDLVDLMYIICSKIYGFPALLNIFFHDKQWLTTPQKKYPNDVMEIETPSDGKKPEYEFLLFTYLLRFVHREGQSGDFARTGLLFLMEMATNQLGEFIMESDFATIMAAGLGALYSQLPRKLAIKDDAELNVSPAAYLLGQDLDLQMPDPNTELSSSPEFKSALDSFLKLLEFCQDVLIRCPNVHISLTLLQSIRTIFLENILYPSILECSDTDGSSVAVISYIDLILQTLEQEELSSVVVGFLIGDEGEQLEDREQIPTEHRTSNTFAGSEFTHHKSSPYYSASDTFTLKDLIFSRLKSSSQPTVIATLKLLKTLITKHCRHSTGLLSVYPVTENATKPAVIAHHIREIELYCSLVEAIDEKHAPEVLINGYDNYLSDIEAMMDNDRCYQLSTSFGWPTAELRGPKIKRRRSLKYSQRYENGTNQPEATVSPTLCKSAPVMFKHHIRPTDPLLQILLSLLSHFFAQSSELNLALTGVISALALCPYRTLEGWITFRESDRAKPDDVLVLSSTERLERINLDQEQDKIRVKDIYAHFDSTELDEDDEEDDRSIDYRADRFSRRRKSAVHFKSYPPFFTLFRTLTQQVDYYRSEIDGFDQLLDERRNGLLFGESTNTVPSITGGSRRGSIFKTDTNARRGSIRPSVPSMLAGDGLTTANAGTNSPLPSSITPITPLSPLDLHARKTQNTRIQPLFPSNFVTEPEEPILDLDKDDEDTFAPHVDPSQQRRLDKTKEITISMLLNNVVILEEAIKEIVALIQVRRSLGVDTIQYT
ncbi:hypothetical protein EC973_008057 [Apophysomyces ossiformis]|uniref:FHF complex subunit HOOK-interacting protein C-terminal domain-containing protein n=1 Tax=Apophysomyces ossiformis TaxID=679940 RepID=A0A8H7BT51_9FUNG|nr:hypothetical protein EC973_008057 [Apophysomyces ossiformis]